MNELQVRQALLSEGEILSLKYSGIGSITITLVSTKHWVAEIGLSKLQMEQKCLKVFCNKWYLQTLNMRY